MKKIWKTLAMLLMLTAIVYSCKKNENNTVDPNGTETDTMNMSVDTIGPALDSSATLNSDENGKNGTTGATGEGSTGSGTAGSTQKGNQNIKTDSIK
ncbi:hypothetical protein [Flavobacterium sp. DG2-3]|uniref:hypothetical protein n=1 Tax=Flavobacterium sp. DG2-3 TaxID=3068317 RepID=UPI00273EE933|nr:hypothetical protein [Flavobacterium sp. DG2-3]MDP5199060.1 hypothetical protein [Flavobacterium sp. DG2-3]